MTYYDTSNRIPTGWPSLLPTIIGANTTQPSGGLLGGLASLGGSGGLSSVAKLFGIGG